MRAARRDVPACPLARTALAVALAAAVATAPFAANAGPPTVAAARSEPFAWPAPTYHLDAPEGAAADPAGNVYIADTGASRVVRFGADGGTSVLGGPGSGPGAFDHPSGVAVSPDGAFVYVADTGNHRIQKFAADGRHLMSWGREGGPDARGSGIREFDSPKALAVDGAGFVYVADTGNERIQKFTADGVFVLQWGEPGSTDGQFYEPTGIAVAPGGDIYVVDHDLTNAHVQAFHPDGRFIRRFGGPRKTGPFVQPWGIAIDSTGTVYVTDQMSVDHQVRAFSPTGTFLRSWCMRGYGDRSFGVDHLLGPTGAFVMGVGQGERLVVCDTRNDRLREFSLGGEAVGVRGSWGVAPGRFNQASGVAVDPEGNVVGVSRSQGVPVLENAHRVQKFDAAGTLLAFSPQDVPALPDVRNGYLNRATAVAVDPEGSIYVAEAGNHRVQKFTSGLRYVTKWGERGTHRDRFDSPGGIAIGREDGAIRVFVADTGNNRVLVFNANGGWAIRAWGSEGSSAGRLRRPEGVAVSSDGTVYIADTGNDRIQRFTAEGDYMGSWGRTGDGAYAFRAPQGVAVAPDGSVIVADTGNDRIKRYTKTGVHIETWGHRGADPGEFRLPRGVAVGADGTVYVADTGNHRIQSLPPAMLSVRLLLTRTPAVADYGQPVTLGARLVDPLGTAVTGRTLSLYRSSDGASWSLVQTITAESGVYAATVPIERLTRFRWVCASEEGVRGSEALTSANARALVATPVVPPVVRAGRSVVVSGTLAPWHPSGVRAVRLYADRAVGGRWTPQLTGAATVSTSAGVTRYRGMVTFPARGRWRMRASHRDADHAITYSRYLYVTVR